MPKLKNNKKKQENLGQHEEASSIKSDNIDLEKSTSPFVRNGKETLV